MYEPTSYDGLTKQQAVKEYLEESIACLQLYRDFDTYGHIDYISRYMPYEDQELHYLEHPKLWDQVFQILIDGNKAIEINTRRLDLPSAVESLMVLYKRFKDLGGRYVTLGSDAHYPEHGTDTMAYTSSALSYMLINLGKPVVLTGSQVPLNLANSDARSNLDLAFTIATSNLTGVFIAFGNKVIKGDCAKKIFAKNFNAFESVNETPVLFFDKNGVKKNLPQKEIFGDFFVMEKLEPRVMAISITPGLKPDIIDFAIAQGYKGIVLECFGAGGVATDKNDFLPAIKRAIKAGVRVVCVSQCLFDGVDLTLYPMGILAAQAGVESGGVMKTVKKLKSFFLGNLEQENHLLLMN